MRNVFWSVALLVLLSVTPLAAQQREPQPTDEPQRLEGYRLAEHYYRQLIARGLDPRRREQVEQAEQKFLQELDALLEKYPVPPAAEAPLEQPAGAETVPERPQEEDGPGASEVPDGRAAVPQAGEPEPEKTMLARANAEDQAELKRTLHDLQRTLADLRVRLAELNELLERMRRIAGAAGLPEDELP